MVHHTCALTQAHKHEGQVLQPETAAFRDLVRGGISDKERKESVLQGGQEGRPRKASVKVKCHSAASGEPKCKGWSAGEKSWCKDRSRTRVKSLQRRRTCGKFVVRRGSEERHFFSTVHHIKMTGTL